MILENAVKSIKNMSVGDIENTKLYVSCKYPFTLKALQKIDKDYIQPKRRKGYNLIFRDSKKHGRRIYGRLSHNGKMLPTKFCTYTDNIEEAVKYLVSNKEKLINGYFSKKDCRIYKYLETFYEGQIDLPERTRKEFKDRIKYKFIPFLKQEKITDFGQISKYTLIKYQQTLLEKGIDSGTKDKRKNLIPVKPQTVNNYTSVLKRIFEQLEKDKIIENNPLDSLKRLKVPEFERKERGCYELEKISGIFAKKWKDELSFLLCLIIYTTGMRNSEIKNITMKSIETQEGRYFISINKSKTANGIRLIPLHEKVYNHIKAYAIKKRKKENGIIFPKSSNIFTVANKMLGKKLKMNDIDLKRENLTFYSGRHFWKTLMNTEGLGEDIEEIWMGHRVTKSVKKLYNHQDKIGKRRSLEKADKMFEILDRCIFEKE